MADLHCPAGMSITAPFGLWAECAATPAVRDYLTAERPGHFRRFCAVPPVRVRFQPGAEFGNKSPSVVLALRCPAGVVGWPNICCSRSSSNRFG